MASKSKGSKFLNAVAGVNEKGLYVGVFYFPGYADYQREDEGQLDITMAPWELGTYLLSQYSTVKEVREAMKKLRVVAVVLDEFAFVPPLHGGVHRRRSAAGGPHRA